MNLIHVKWKSRDFLVIILFLQFIAYAMMFLDVSIAWQVIGFFYFTFVPGFIILKLLKLNELGRLETVLFSVGLSVAFLILAGLLINEFSSILSVSKPLSPMPLMIILNGFILIGALLVYLRSEYVKLFDTETLGLSLLAPLLITLPILSVVGTFCVNAMGNNSILLFLIFAIAIIFFLAIVPKRIMSSKLYALIILSIAVALLFHSSLITNYIYGTDIHTEYYVYKLVQENGYWDSTAYFDDPRFGRFNTMLSTTMLPTIYANILNMDGTWILKILFPLLFSLVPLGLYKMWQINLGKKTAFISAFLLMSQVTFYMEMIGLTRQMIAEFFFVLLFLVLLSEKLDSSTSKLFFVILSFALITSHYALSLIFLFFISTAWIYMFLTKNRCKNLTLSLVILFFAMMFSWYIYTSSSASFESFLSFGDTVYRSLHDFFDPTSRGGDVMRGLGMEAAESYWQALSRMFAYATQFFIVVGFVMLIVRRKVRANMDEEYVLFSSFSMLLLAMCILLPRFALTLNMTRFYHIILFFLAPFFALGCETFIGFLAKRKKQLYVSILVVSVLVPYFLFQTGFIYEVTGSESWSVPLSKYRMDKVRLYGSAGFIDEQSVVCAQWMSRNIDIRQVQIYADGVSYYKVLPSYGGIYEGDINVLSNTTIVVTNGTVYLSKLNVIYEKIVSRGLVWNSSELSFLFNDLDKVYTNGGSEVYISVVGGQ